MEAIYSADRLAARSRAELASMFRSASRSRRARVRRRLPTPSEPVYVDRGMWEKIVLNLLSNAFKFTFDGEIAVTHRDDRASERRARRSRHRERASPRRAPAALRALSPDRSARGRTHEGTGIGLALVQELVKLHGGTITSREQVGEGTRFVILLPTGKAICRRSSRVESPCSLRREPRPARMSKRHCYGVERRAWPHHESVRATGVS